MSPVTHFFASWLLASAPRLDRRDVTLITVAGIAPDVDGLGIFPELLTRTSAHPLNWFSQYHHVLAHNLPFALATAGAIFLLARRKWLTSVLGLVAVHFAFLNGYLGLPRTRRILMAHSLFGTVLIQTTTGVVGAVGTE